MLGVIGYLRREWLRLIHLNGFYCGCHRNGYGGRRSLTLAAAAAAEPRGKTQEDNYF